MNYTVQETDAVTGLGYNYKIGINQGPHQTLVTGDWSWNKAFTPQLQWGLFASRDWVESMAALQNSVHYELGGWQYRLPITPPPYPYRLFEHKHAFSDGQNRQQQRARVVFDAWPEQGITLQASQKHQIGEKNVQPCVAISIPNSLMRPWVLWVGVNAFKVGNGMRALGAGHQYVLNEANTPARLADLQISSPVRGNSYFKLRAGESETRGVNGPGYVYRYFDVQWIWRLDR